LYSTEAHAYVFEADVDRLLEESRRCWATFAHQQGLQLAIGTDPERLPVVTGRVSGIAIELRAAGHRYRGFVTESRATARLPLRGKVRLRPSTDFDQFLKPLLRRRAFDDPVLDAPLTLRGSSASLIAAILDDPVRALLRRLVQRPLDRFVYDSGAITIRWAGVERSLDLLAEVVEITAHLAVTGSEVSAYR
jgi:hypothetical protein